jgi:hypothetical protein
MWLTGLFTAHIVLGVLLAITSALVGTFYAEMLVSEEMNGDPVGLGVVIGAGCLGLLTLPLLLLTAVLFWVWLYRANKNARALGAKGMNFTPGWCVGWWFVPIMNLFMPYRVTAEIYRASDPEAGAFDWQNRPAATILGLWWGSWVLSNLISNVEMQLALPDDPATAAAGSWVGVGSCLLTVLSAYFAIRVVRLIHQRQEAKADRRRKEPPAAPVEIWHPVN